MNESSSKRTIRNLILFAIVAVAGGWIGIALDALLQLTPSESLGMLVWLLLPLGTSLVLRAFAGDGWRDTGIRPHLARNLRWYAVSLLIYPVVFVFTLLIDQALGGKAFSTGSFASPAVVISLFGLALVPTFLKNILEEFTWRGYMTPRVHSLGIHDVIGHVLVGLVWWAWHLPYYLFFLDRTVLQTYTPLNLEGFLLASFVETIALAIVLGELRLLTDSTWPAVLMHTVYNVLGATLIAVGLLRIGPETNFLTWPGPGGAIPIVILLVVGIGLRRARRRQERAKLIRVEPAAAG